MSPSRIHRCFSFIDLCGFIAYIDGNGDSAGLNALTELRAVTRRAADEHGVRIAKWLGDGALLVGPEDQHVRQCTLEILQQGSHRLPLPVRAGLSSGEVLLLDGDDYIGTAINTAARLCEAAPPGQLLIAADPGKHPHHTGRRIEVRGMREPVTVHLLDPAGTADETQHSERDPQTGPPYGGFDTTETAYGRS